MARLGRLLVNFVLLVGPGLAACGGAAAPSNGVGPAGGTVTSSSGASVVIPPGALALATAVSAASASGVAGPVGVTLVSDVVTFGPEGQTFALPVTVTLPFSASRIPSGKTASSIVVYTAPVGSGTFTALATSAVDATHVSAQVSHFSNFVAGVPQCTTNSDCPAGSQCVQGLCTGATCHTALDCPPGQICDGVTQKCL